MYVVALRDEVRKVVEILGRWASSSLQTFRGPALECPLRQNLFSCLTCNPAPASPADAFTASGVELCLTFEAILIPDYSSHRCVPL